MRWLEARPAGRRHVLEVLRQPLEATLSTMYRGSLACGRNASMRWQVLQFIEIAHEHPKTERG
jgi:hypothetical protein